MHEPKESVHLLIRIQEVGIETQRKLCKMHLVFEKYLIKILNFFGFISCITMSALRQVTQRKFAKELIKLVGG